MYCPSRSRREELLAAVSKRPRALTASIDTIGLHDGQAAA